jgi:hypothetical protein
MLSFLEDDDVALLALAPAPRRALLRAVKALSLPPDSTTAVALAASAPMQRETTQASNLRAAAAVTTGPLGGGAAVEEGGDELDRMCYDPVTMVRWLRLWLGLLIRHKGAPVTLPVPGLAVRR